MMLKLLSNKYNNKMSILKSCLMKIKNLSKNVMNCKKNVINNLNILMNNMFKNFKFKMIYMLKK